MAWISKATDTRYQIQIILYHQPSPAQLNINTIGTEELSEPIWANISFLSPLKT